MNNSVSLPAAMRAGVAFAAILLVSACGGSGGGGIGSTPAPAPAPAPTPTPTPVPTPTPTPSQSAEVNRSDGPVIHNATTAWTAGYTGSGVTIGIIDSGIDIDSPEFAGRISTASRDVAGSRGINGEDDHGTNVAMIAAAARDGLGVVGIAYNATLAVMRADSPGSCATEGSSDPDAGCSFYDNDIARGIDAAVAAGAKVINLSLGGGLVNSQLRAAIGRASTAGVVIVVSAGNDGDSTDPTIDPNNPDPFAASTRAAGNGNVIIVGSIDENRAFSDFSNRAGSEAQWFLSAQGERVCCVYENGTMKIVTNPDGTRSVYVISGTSFSAPQVSGAAALLMQAFPNLSATQVVDLLLRSARDAGANGPDGTFGRGILDIAAAFQPQGSLSLAGSPTPMPAGDGTGVTSAAMGDAARRAAGLSAIMLDSYGRAYTVGIGASIASAPVEQRLAGALAGEVRSVRAGTDTVSVAYSVDARGQVSRMGWRGALRLSREDAEVAKVLAARIAARIAPGTTMAIGFAQGADGLTAQLQGRSQPAFLIAERPLDAIGFNRSGLGSFALRHNLSRDWGLTFSAERGTVRSAAPLHLTPSAAVRPQGDAATRFGLAMDWHGSAVDALAGASLLDENRTVLGARFHDALAPGGARSLFADAGIGWQPAPGWRLGAAVRGGITWPQAGGPLMAQSRLYSSAWAIDATRTGLFQPNDSIGLRLAQPLRVEGGGLLFNLPVGYSYATLSPTYGVQRLNLAPQGRELDAELVWRGQLLGGSTMASLYYRKDPGHFATVPDDKGLALSWVGEF